MKLYNVIVVFDVYACAENEEDARTAAIANILEGLTPSEQVAHDVGKRTVRAAWLNEKPLVGGLVSDTDFESLKGKTTEDVWTMLNKKADDKKSKAG